MEKKKIDYSKYLFLIIVVIVILMFVFGKRGGEEIEVLEEELLGLGESAGSGILEIETIPNNADIYVDGILNGKSPDPMYNVPAGLRNVVIKKDGYEDFVSEVDINSGKKIVLEITLAPAIEEKVEVIETVEEPEVTEIIEGDVEVIGIIDEKAEIIETVEDEETPESGNIINLGKKFLLYYDFSEGEFSDIRSFEQDIFSKRYKGHLIFTRYDPVNIKTIAKGIDSVEKEDCIGIKGQFESLYSGQSLCVITKEGQIVAIGGSWEDTENAELEWKVFS